ncbi:SH3 type 3 domain-containing protein [Leptotrichia trevisanii]|uniref:SH3 type 3 domain-containing protein n=1 Tax=Leptotrichia trevisanii TaxID=109328 RepID=A0A510KM55_9FUSO|nr:SH3 domain-containing protein [Leptotrichia trevisanii]BBM52810.1 SH3 type 3 domain-containing protein [Leptotrichia trevisanii]
MKLKNFFFCYFFLLISIISFGQNKKSDEIILIDDGVILDLKGTFKINWDKSDPDVPCSAIEYGEMLFYPDNKDIVNEKAIVLKPRDFDYHNWDETRNAEKEFADMEKAKVEILKKTFPEEVKKMEKIQKGELQSPVRVKIKKVTPYTECDFTTVYAQVIELKKIEGAKPKITKLKVKKSDESDDFDEPHLDEVGYLQEYEVKTKDEYVNMREKPTTDSKIVLKLKNDETVKYIMSDGNWYYVYKVVYPSKNNKDSKIREFRGFVHKSQLRKINY